MPTDRRLAIVTEVLLVSGSLRAESVNGAVLRTAAALAGDGMRPTLYVGLGTLPHFNPTNIRTAARYPWLSPICVVGSLTRTPCSSALPSTPRVQPPGSGRGQWRTRHAADGSRRHWRGHRGGRVPFGSRYREPHSEPTA